MGSLFFIYIFGLTSGLMLFTNCSRLGLPSKKAAGPASIGPASIVAGSNVPRTIDLLAGVIDSRQPATTSSNTSILFYVSPSGDDNMPGTIDQPLRTLEAAKQKVRVVRSAATGNIHVLLRAGTYYLDQPFRLDENDGGVNGNQVYYSSFPGEKAIISGGALLTNWQPTNNRGIYYASAQRLNFRKLYTNSEVLPPIRAHYPKDHFLTLTDYGFDGGNVATSLKIASDPAIDGSGNEVRFAGSEMVILKEHTMSSLRVNYAGRVSPTDLRISLVDQDARAEGLYKSGSNAFMVNVPFRTYFTNSLDFVTQPGDWYLDRTLDRVYYIPYALAELSEVVAPRLETVISISGTSAAQPVTNIVIEDLDIRHSNWTFASDNPLLGGQAGRCTNSDAIGGACEGKGLVMIVNARAVLLRRNKISRSGNNGVIVGTGTNGVIVAENYISDVVINGILLNTFSSFLYSSLERNSQNTSIDNNIIRNIGIGYDGMGIVVPYGVGTLITNNRISTIANSGISFGYYGTAIQFPVSGNEIRNNDISNVMLLYQDGGGIYTLTGSDGLVIKENYIHDISQNVRGPKTWAGLQPAIYLDKLTTGAIVRDNYMARLFDGVFSQVEAGSEARNNVIKINFATDVTNVYTTDSYNIFQKMTALGNLVETHVAARPDIVSRAGPVPATLSYWNF